MKTIQTIPISSIILMLFCFFLLSNACHFEPFSNKLRAESFRQEIHSGLQYVSVIEIDDEFENEMPDENLRVGSRLTGFHCNKPNFHIFFEKSVDLIKISFHGHSPRSPSLQ